jgi:hypothetical protein
MGMVFTPSPRPAHRLKVGMRTKYLTYGECASLPVGALIVIKSKGDRGRRKPLLLTRNGGGRFSTRVTKTPTFGSFMVFIEEENRHWTTVFENCNVRRIA